MANVLKLKAKIVERDMSIEQVAKSIGIDTSTMYRKLANNGNSFTVAEATNIGLLLELNASEMNDIFFAV